MSQILNINYQEAVSREFRIEQYRLHKALKNAVEVAIALEQPLLLTGEPGTGKTELAYKIAIDLAKEGKKKFLPKPIVFNTKTNSAAQDLFYSYDALSHFQQSNIKKDEGEKYAQTSDFIELQALGKAIAQTNPGNLDSGKFNTILEKEPMSSVVLIDEIDKAPRDFTNDILNEIKDYFFQIKEQDNYRISKAADQQIVVIMTSNSEKNLPDAFLRRCVFYHIPFPENEELMAIAKIQLGNSTPFTEKALEVLIKEFKLIRGKTIRKKPATAELLAWLQILGLKKYMEQDEKGQRALMIENMSILVKTAEDFREVEKLFA